MAELNRDVMRKRIKQLREEIPNSSNPKTCISQADFCKKLGIDIDRSTLSQYEGQNYQSVPDARFLYALSTLCNASTDWILGLPHSVRSTSTTVKAITNSTILSESSARLIHKQSMQSKENYKATREEEELAKQRFHAEAVIETTSDARRDGVNFLLGSKQSEKLVNCLTKCIDLIDRYYRQKNEIEFYEDSNGDIDYHVKLPQDLEAKYGLRTRGWEMLNPLEASNFYFSQALDILREMYNSLHYQDLPILEYLMTHPEEKEKHREQFEMLKERLLNQFGGNDNETDEN